MCGIAGILNINGSEPRITRPIRAMAGQMRHRGPDGEGYALVHADGSIRTYRGDDTPMTPSEIGTRFGYPDTHINSAIDAPSILALGHRRLSIIDLSSHGHQPMCTTDLRYWIVFNGEIYNYQELAKELTSKGINLHGRSDTEVLLNAYAHWGPDCLNRFNGMFAIAIWDNVKKQLFCARDRIGIKPFYFTFRNDNFIFASDIKTIIASGLYDASPDMEGLYLAMAFGIAPRPKTAFRDLESLSQAHWMLIDRSGRVQTQRYWSIPVCTQDHTMSEFDATDLLDEQLTASIKRRLIADVPVGTFMSGGIDSTTISAIASNLHPGINAFTLAFEDTAPELDEVSQATATARMHDMQHIVHTVDAQKALDDLHSWIDGYEEPYYAIAANHVISSVVSSHGIKVILNGLGGDELFAGYSWYRNIDYWQIARRFRKLLRPLSPVFRGKWQLLARSSEISSADRFHSFVFGQFSDEELQTLFMNIDACDGDSIEYVHKLYADGLDFEDDIEALSYMDLMNYVGNHHVHRVDQFTMMHSLEGRFPFLDHELVEAAFRIPSEHKVRGKIQKYVLRQVARQHIAPGCLSMAKKGFALPLRQWMNGPLESLISRKLSLLKDRDSVNADTISQWTAEFESGDRSATDIWHLTALEMWYERFID